MRTTKSIRTCGQILFWSLISLPYLNSCNKNNISPKDSVVNATPSRTLTTNTLTYQLVWSDEFNSASIDPTNWTFDTGGGGWGNNELEYYQAANATISNGNLVITAKKQRVGANAYTSARLKTQSLRQFTYGKIEARIKLPVVKGLWPAFWMLGSNITTVGWPQCGETDIMEHINTDSLIYGTAHWYNNGHVSSGGSVVSSPSVYHIYDIEWTPTSITWHIDGVQYYTANVTNISAFQNPFFIILNVAVGGNWTGKTIDTTKLPASMYVDYVRVYQLM